MSEFKLMPRYMSFIKRHESKSVADLKLVRRSICENDKNLINKDQVKIIDMLINGDKLEIQQSCSHVQTDIRVAKSYINKISNSEKRGISFTLTLSEWRRLQTRKRCEYTGIELLDDVAFDDMRKRTIDRIDNSKGYETGNVKAVCFRANQMKNFLFENPETSDYRMHGSEFIRFSAEMVKQIKDGAMK